MRPLLHVVAILLALPQLAICAIFLTLGHLTGGHTLGSLFTRSLDLLDAIFGWAGLAIVVSMLLLIAAAFSARWRPIGSGAIVLLVGAGLWMVWDAPVISVPAIIAAAISVYLLTRDLRPAPVPSPQ